MKIFLKRLAAVGLGLGISLAGVNTAFAANLTWTADQTVDLSSPNIDLTINNGSEADSLVVNDGNLAVVVANGDQFVVESATRGLRTTGETSATIDNDCTAGLDTLTITGGTDNETIFIIPTTNQCGTSGGTTSGGSGGGGGGSNNDGDTTTPPSIPAPGAAHSAGSVVKSSDGTVWFITPQATRRAFTSGGAFLSYGFLSWSQVVDANAGDLALPTGSFIPPQDGKVVCSDRDDSFAIKGTCYLMTQGKRAAFTSAAVFTGQGFKFARALTGDVSFMTTDTNISSASAAHRTGVLVNNSGTIQLVGPNSTLMGVPSESVFTSWGYSFLDTVPANAADKAMPQSGVMQSRVTGQLSPQ
jgi:hypothetical protein